MHQLYRVGAALAMLPPSLYFRVVAKSRCEPCRSQRRECLRSERVLVSKEPPPTRHVRPVNGE